MEQQPLDPHRLTGAIGHLLDTGLFSDVAFLVGEEKYRFNVHRTVLGARSSVFATMLEERWAAQQTKTDSDSKNKVFINFPDHGVDSFRIFLKFLYTDLLTAKDLTTLLDLMKLAHLYDIPHLLRIVVDRLLEFVGDCDPERANDCLAIYKNSRCIDEKLEHLALQFFMKHVRLAGQDGRYLSWDMETIRSILDRDFIDVREVDIFKALLNWAKWSEPGGEDASQRSKILPQLLKMIRFPTMGIKDFGSEIVPTQVLPQDEVLKLFIYFSNPGENSTTYSINPRARPTISSEPRETDEIPWFTIAHSQLGRAEVVIAKTTKSIMNQLSPEIRLEVMLPICLTGIQVAASDLRGHPGRDVLFVAVVKSNGCTVARGVLPFQAPSNPTSEKAFRMLIRISLGLSGARLHFNEPLVLQIGKRYDIFVHCKLTAGLDPYLSANNPENVVLLCRRDELSTTGFRDEEQTVNFCNNVSAKLKCFGGTGLTSRWITRLMFARVVMENPAPCPIT